MALSLAEAIELRAVFKAALVAIASGQEYEIGDRRLKRADGAWAAQQFAYYDRLVDQLTAGGRGGITVKRVIPRDL